ILLDAAIPPRPVPKLTPRATSPATMPKAHPHRHALPISVAPSRPVPRRVPARPAPIVPPSRIGCLVRPGPGARPRGPPLVGMAADRYDDPSGSAPGLRAFPVLIAQWTTTPIRESGRPTRSTNAEMYVPKKLFFTKGVGVHREKLSSFELAL